jgi:ABC-type nitrate/sulfonate/bicarbonate transport system substrate-binding protein
MKRVSLIFVSLLLLQSCSGGDRIPLKVVLGTRAISKLPFVIALDQGLYEKHGLDVDLQMPASDFDGARKTFSSRYVVRAWRRFWADAGVAEEWQEDILVDGLTPNIVKKIDRARFPHWVAVAATDCILRAHIIGGPHIRSLEELKGKRIGISARRDTTTGFGALTLARRMGWDPVRDVSIKLGGRDVEALREGLVDAIVASEMRYAVAKSEGFPILADTQAWGVALAGNSVMAEKEWLADPSNHEAVRRLLRALAEALAIYHRDRELGISILQDWHGIDDREVAETAYDRGRWMPRKPYPCYEGVDNTFELYDSNEMRKYSPGDFYEDGFMKTLDESGFIDTLYRIEN